MMLLLARCCSGAGAPPPSLLHRALLQLPPLASSPPPCSLVAEPPQRSIDAALLPRADLACRAVGDAGPLTQQPPPWDAALLAQQPPPARASSCASCSEPLSPLPSSLLPSPARVPARAAEIEGGLPLPPPLPQDWGVAFDFAADLALDVSQGGGERGSDRDARGMLLGFLAGVVTLLLAVECVRPVLNGSRGKPCHALGQWLPLLLAAGWLVRPAEGVDPFGLRLESDANAEIELYFTGSLSVLLVRLVRTHGKRVLCGLLQDTPADGSWPAGWVYKMRRSGAALIAAMWRLRVARHRRRATLIARAWRGWSARRRLLVDESGLRPPPPMVLSLTEESGLEQGSVPQPRLETPLSVALRAARDMPSLPRALQVAGASTRNMNVPRRSRQTPRSAGWAERCAMLRDVGAALAAVPSSTWSWLGTAARLQRWLKRGRVAIAARRERLSRLLALPPRPMPAFDVGYDAAAGVFTYRDALARVATQHPAAATGAEVPAYQLDGTVVPPRSPPIGSGVVLCPEQSGAWCYYDTATGTSTWEPPEGSTPLGSQALLPEVLPSFRSPPPRLGPQIRLGVLRDTDWLLLREDAVHNVKLVNKLTGAVRAAPWISLLSPDGQVYFANLISRETRWLAPHLWMEGWIERPPSDAPAGQCWAGKVNPHYSGGEHSLALTSFLSGRRLDDRDMLPQQLARKRVDGGAPYLGASGRPQYEPDMFDTPLTYPEQQPPRPPQPQPQQQQWCVAGGSCRPLPAAPLDYASQLMLQRELVQRQAA